MGQAGGVAKQPPPPTTDGPMGVGVAVLWAGLTREGAWLTETGRSLNQHQQMGVGEAEWEEHAKRRGCGLNLHQPMGVGGPALEWKRRG